MISLMKKTRKSILNGDNEHHGETVGHLMTFGRGKNYVAWIYFHIHNVTFTDDILIELFGEISGPNISAFIIGKPGTKPALFKQFNDTHPDWSHEQNPNPKLFGGLTAKQIGESSRNTHKHSAGTIMSDQHDKNRGRKINLTRKNQGH